MFEMGVGIRNPLFFVGVVENGLDPRKENRVQVRAFGIHGTIDQIPTEDLPWAICVAGNYHMNNLPQTNHWVFGVFLDGRDAQQPLILGTIPTFMNDIVDPEKSGYGKLPTNHEEQAINGGKPEQVGKPPMNDLACGETPHETCVLEHEINRVKDIRVAQDPDNPNQKFTGWSETPTAYAAKYGLNRVYDSPDGKTTIELDSSPGAERLMINHRGSYIQVDSNGTRTDKSYGDHQEVNDKNNMVYIGGRNSVTIMGDSHVYVDGNKIEEINGDLVQVVHGNHILGVGGQSNINASEEVQIRGAQLRLESNVTGINLKAAKGLFAETGESMHFKSGIAIFQEATNSFNMKAGDNIYIQAAGDGNISATTVNIDDLISMANGDAQPATAADPSKSVEAPEPPAKSTSSTAKSRNKPNVSTSGAASIDDPAENESTSGPDDGLRGPETRGEGLSDLRDFIGEGEGGYSGVNRGTRNDEIVGSVVDGARRNGKLIEDLTFREIFELQSISDPNNQDRIFAVGKYQIVPSTMKEIFPHSGLSLDDTFSASNQDILGNTLLLGNPNNNYYKRKGLSDYIRGESSNLYKAEVELAQEWASIPHPATGKSVYGSGNAAKNATRESVQSALIRARKEYSGE